jgi:hypothetical protein
VTIHNLDIGNCNLVLRFLLLKLIAIQQQQIFSTRLSFDGGGGIVNPLCDTCICGYVFIFMPPSGTGTNCVISAATE